MLAIPTYPYNPHSVWNRNQLGGLDSSSMLTMAVAGAALWFLFIKKGKLF